MFCAFLKYWRLALMLTAFAAAAASAQTPPTAANQGSGRFLVYFDEFSAFLSNEAKTVIATPETNKYLAQTRSSIVTDQLEEDGIARTMIRQEPIGQTGSSDPTVYNRRVDIILER